MADSARLKAAQGRENLSNNWQTSLLKAPINSAGCCLASLCCPPCASFALRKQFLHGDLSQNTCCLGQMPCSGRCGESKCPALCLVCESCLCFTLSVASTRFAIQDEQALANTSCDNCIIGTMVALQQLACICQILAICFPELDNMADCIVCLSDICFCATCACMQAQHKLQLDYRDENFGTADTPPPGPMDVPPLQSMKAQPGYPANRGQQQPQPQPQYYNTQPPPQQQMQHPQRK